MSLISKWLKNQRIQLLVLVFVAAVLRTFFLFKHQTLTGNSARNVVQALQILQQPAFLPNFDPNCSVLYNYALAGVLFFWRDPLMAPKFFTLIFGVLLVIPFYGTIKNYFNQRIAFYSSLLLVICPIHIVQSSTVSSDAVYYFFIFMVFYYLSCNKPAHFRFSNLLLSALWFNVAALLRFEAWIFIPFLFVAVWIRNKTASFIYCILLLIAPCFWLCLNHAYHHNALVTFQTPALTARAQILLGSVPYDPRLFSWLFVLYKSFGLTIVIGGLSGVVLSIWSRKNFFLAVFFLIGFITLTVNAYAGRMWHHERYSIMSGLLLIPYAVYFMCRIAIFFKIKNLLFFLMLLIFSMIDIWHIKCAPSSAMPCMLTSDHIFYEAKTIGEWLHHNSSAKNKIILTSDPYDIYPQNIMLQSGISFSNFSIIEGPSPFLNDHRTATSPSINSIDPDVLINEIKGGKFEYLVLHSKGLVQRFLKFDLDQKEFVFHDVNLKVVFEQKTGLDARYLIYRISSIPALNPD